MASFDDLKNNHNEKAKEERIRLLNQNCKDQFKSLVQQHQYVGDVFSMSFETALVLVHDRYRMDVGGIPSMSFLIATRADAKGLEEMGSTDSERPIFEREDASVLLLRVMDAAPLPNDREATQIRVQTAQSMNSPDSPNWDSPEGMDGSTAHLLSYAGLKCRIIGTFYLEQAKENALELSIKFGSDISNFYPNRGLKVYKPNSEALKLIVNYRDPLRNEDHKKLPEVNIGTIRYASTNRSFQGVSNVKVFISPADLKTQKTAVFGMTRTGKSNTTKIMAKAVFDLRKEQVSQNIGQLIFDLNGEYANENVQDNNNALKNIGKMGEGLDVEVITYGVSPHKYDKHRILMLINFHDANMIQIGKELIDKELEQNDSNYLKNFRQVRFQVPDAQDRSEVTRYNRRLIVYRALLVKAGYDAPNNAALKSTASLFCKELLEGRHNHKSHNFPGMNSVPFKLGDQKGEGRSNRFRQGAEILALANPSWSALATAFEILYEYLSTEEYNAFNRWYIKDRPNASGDGWEDSDLERLIKMFDKSLPNGIRLMGLARRLHTSTTTEDYARQIYKHLAKGRLVIVDQSSGDWDINDSSARRIVQSIFSSNQALFRNGEENIPDILIYIEEAHNLLPSSSDTNTQDIWVRTAKEGAKYRIGMVYATQEVSSIQKNILKNTSNWFIGHLNNTDETKELTKYYDFADFESSILRAQDKGFLRIKTLSNPYVIPAQIKKFELNVGGTTSENLSNESNQVAEDDYGF